MHAISMASIQKLSMFIVFILTFHSSLTSSQHISAKANKCVGHDSSHHFITVDIHGSGDFSSVQAAVNSVPEKNRKNVIIKIKAGYYKEKVVVPASKPYITFQGAGRDTTVIEWHDRASDLGPGGQPLNTYQSASVAVFANYFSARNISFKNSAPAPMPGMQGRQAVAFRISGDKAYFSGCGFYGAQDTLCDDAGRHYFKECFIEGSIDFIFGNGQSMYKECELHSIAAKFGSIVAQNRKSPKEKTGFAFVHCKVTGTGPLYVGRAMGQYSRIVFSYTYFDDVAAHVQGGWDDWNQPSRMKTAYFGVYNCWGPGVEDVIRTSWVKKLDCKSARPFLVKSFVNGRHWILAGDE